MLPPKHVLVNELDFFFVVSSIPRSCFGGSGVSNEKLFMRAFNFFRLVFGLCDTVKIDTKQMPNSKLYANPAQSKNQINQKHLKS